jgi:hypothetical protein
MGESNAESVARDEAIKKDVERMKRKRKTRGPQQHVLHNNAQEIELETSYHLYHNPNQRVTHQQHEFLYDTGAGLTMISGNPAWAWRNLRECMYTLGGCFIGITLNDLQIGEYHGIMTLNNGETVRIIIPEAVQLPPNTAHSNLLANTAFLLAGHKFVSDLTKPQLKFKGGGQYTMSVQKGHNVFYALPTSAQDDTPHRKIYLHKDEPYDPPTYINHAIFQHANRANLQTPTAFTWHLRYACKCLEVLKHTQHNVTGMNVQLGSWTQLKQQLPCAACLAGHMRKTKKTPVLNYTDIQNLAISWTPSTEQKHVTPNHKIALDWGIINKTAKSKTNNVFALYLDTNTGLVFAYPAQSRGEASRTILTRLYTTIRHTQSNYS